MEDHFAEDINYEGEDYTVNDQDCSTFVHNVSNINSDFVIKIGMKFGSEDESYEAYNSNALAKGFGIRKGANTYNRNKELTRCLFLCSCEGQSPLYSNYLERKRQRLEYRCGRMTRIKFKISNEIWEVFGFSNEHNHPMIEENLKHFILSGRKLTTATKDILSSMVDADIRTKKVVRYLQNEAGGIENARFIEQDAHNFIQAHKRSMINNGDAQTLVDRFIHMQSEDSNFFYSFQVDEDGNIKSTQKNESTNRVFTEMACKTMSLTEFVNHYEQRAAEMRDIDAT
ncbi:putative protein FAR1-RELATED SEQUENCE 10 [Nicotiana tomentosiformis]|uniref:putative protein FAR1-RELATED SEQUENCE 10 n=1 Tax=Nicotiana tomentosiformis TaxID=4098 RepID=UPI00051BFCED